MTLAGSGAAPIGLEPAQLESYRDNGYLLVEGVVPPTFLRAVQHALEGQVEDRIAAWQRAGLLVGEPVERDFGLRYHCAWLAAGRPAFGAMAPDEPRLADLLAPILAERWLVDLALGVLGVSEVTLLDSCFYRAKFPDDRRTSLPWHQDAQCLGPISGVDFVTAWIPLVDVSEHNSCLELSSIGGSREIFASTMSAQSNYVCMRMQDVLRLEDRRKICIRRGDLLFLSPFVPHRSLDNVAAETRWSLDLRLAPA